MMRRGRAVWPVAGVLAAGTLVLGAAGTVVSGIDAFPGALDQLARSAGIRADRLRVDPAAARAEDAYAGGMRLAGYLREEPSRAPGSMEAVARDLAARTGAGERLDFMTGLGRPEGERSFPPLLKPRKVVTDTVADSPVDAAMLELYAGTGKRFQGKDRTRVIRESGTLPPPVARELAGVILAVTEAAHVREEVVASSLFQVGGAFDSKSRKTAELLREFLGRWWDGDVDRENGFRELAPALNSVDLVTLERGGIALAAALDRAGDRLAALPPASVDTVGFQYQWDTPIGRIAVGGKGDNVYDGSYAVVLDLGGNDRYRGPGSVNGRSPVGVVLDLGGNDVYAAGDSADTGPGGAILGYAGVVDLGGGNDAWGSADSGSVDAPAEAGSGCRDLGFGFLGVGWIRDDGGNDRYVGSTLSEGCGLYGLGLLLDEGGDDAYTLIPFGGTSSLPVGDGQGFGGPAGVGTLLDLGGNDAFVSRSPETPGAHGGMVLGASSGIDPWIAGGVGILVDRDGKDSFEAAGPCLGAAADAGLGMFVDLAGDDDYRIHGAGGGYGIRLGMGAFLDRAGDDRVIAEGGSDARALGAGVDLGTGVFVDASGDDRYRADGIAFGAGLGEGAGLFGDLGGNNAYDGPGRSGMGFVGPATGGGWRVPTDGVGAFVDLGSPSAAAADRGASSTGDAGNSGAFAPVRGDGAGVGGAWFALPAPAPADPARSEKP